MITKSKHVEAVIRKHWHELIRGGVYWIDGYNNAIHKGFVTTLKTNTDTSNVYFINDPRPKNDKDHRNQPV